MIHEKLRAEMEMIKSIVRDVRLMEKLWLYIVVWLELDGQCVNWMPCTTQVNWRL